MTPRTETLEPIRSALIWVSLAHLLLAAVLAWMTWRMTRGSDVTWLTASSLESGAEAQEEMWFDPADFNPAAATAASSALEPPAQPTKVEPASLCARYITLSRLNTPAAGTASAAPAAALSTSDLTQLDQLDEALYEAFMRAWHPPDPRQIHRERRSVRLDVTLNSDLTIAHSELAAPSGSSELDLSVLTAAEEVAALLRERASGRAVLKFPSKLPSSLANSRYDCRILFHVE